MKKVIKLLLIILIIKNIQSLAQSSKSIFKVTRQVNVDEFFDTIVLYTNIENSIQNIKFKNNISIAKTKQQDNFKNVPLNFYISNEIDTNIFRLKTPEGIVFKNNEGKYVVMINKTGFSTLNLIKKNKATERVIEKKLLLVKPIPNIITTIANKRKGVITVKEIIDSPLIKATCGIPEINKQITITSYVITTLSSGESKAWKYSNTNILSNDAISHIKIFKTGTIMIIQEIHCKLPNGTELTLPDMRFTIK